MECGPCDVASPGQTHPPGVGPLPRVHRRAVLRRRAFLDETVQGVLGQTWQDWELLLMDDGSTEGSHREGYAVAAALASPPVLHIYDRLPALRRRVLLRFGIDADRFDVEARNAADL